MASSPKRSPRSRVRDVLSDCDEITLGHKNHIVNISSASSVESSPGNASAGELARKNREWGRSIDRYVAAVLDDASNSNSRQSGGDLPPSPHPDNHLLAFLGEKSAQSRSINTQGFIDDVSFQPIRPFEDHEGPPVPRRKERMEQQMKKHWKPITAVCLGVVLVLAISLGASKLRNGHHENKTGISAVATPLYPTESPTTALPTYTPTIQPTTGSPTVPIGTKTPTLEPTTAPPTGYPTKPPTNHPTLTPTNRPTMVPEYYQMLKAARYVSGSTERSGGNNEEDPLDDFSSPQSLAFHWLYFEGNPSHDVLEFLEQYAIAVVFFSLTEIRQSSWSNNLAQDDFTATREVCGWDGVRCAYDYTSNMTHVTEIKLASNGLTGPIPKEIGFLPYLIKLDLADNEIVGTIPEEIYNLQNLR